MKRCQEEQNSNNRKCQEEKMAMIEKWKKECIKESSSETIKDTIKIRLYMWELKVNCRRKSLDNRCPICQSEEDTVTKETRNSVGMMRVVKDG